MKTVLELIQATTAFLDRHKVDNPRLNTEHLIAHALGKKRIELYMEFDRVLGEHELAPLRDLVRKRADGRPLQHLLGSVEFHGRIFLIDQRALIPRPETEQLVELILGMRTNSGAVQRVIDVGTGSGVIGLTLAAEWPQAEVHAADVSSEALSLARENAARLGLQERVQFFENDLLDAITSRYDLIVANLPYIASDELPHLSREVQCDPRVALDGGRRGLDLIARLIGQAPAPLDAGGLLALEIGHDQADDVEEMLREKFSDIRIETDYHGVRRFAFASHG